MAALSIETRKLCNRNLRVKAAVKNGAMIHREGQTFKKKEWAQTQQAFAINKHKTFLITERAWLTIVL
jgi:hypothetical protein